MSEIQRENESGANTKQFKSKEKMYQTKRENESDKRENSNAKKWFFKDRFSLGLGDFLPSFFPPLSETKRKLCKQQNME